MRICLHEIIAGNWSVGRGMSKRKTYLFAMTMVTYIWCCFLVLFTKICSTVASQTLSLQNSTSAHLSLWRKDNSNLFEQREMTRIAFKYVVLAMVCPFHTHTLTQKRFFVQDCSTCAHARSASNVQNVWSVTKTEGAREK